MSGGSVIEANTALVGIGISLNDTLAWPFALVVADGVVVGALCQTRDPDIYVVGD
jgi:3-phenylpropionate/trans-cinnamate dioxygenase ferredoxin reductase subunit|tara:strand:+ start:480 stop:644 length:165 start_codon:yes stop_codon:yes gene_type:complete